LSPASNLGLTAATTAKTAATTPAHHRGVKLWINGHAAISRKTAEKINPKERSDEPSTRCSRVNSSCAISDESPPIADHEDFLLPVFHTVCFQAAEIVK
jgi:hypothetical protein